MIADSRLSAFRRRMAQERLPAFLVSDITNVRYLTGFEGVFDDDANVALLVTPEVARVHTDSRYSEAVGVAAAGTPWALQIPGESIYVELAEDVAGDGIGELAVESSVPYGRFRFISEKFGGNVEVMDQWVEALRQVKEHAEVERIAAAAQLTDAAMEHAWSILRPGATEREIAVEIEYYMKRNGADGVAFSSIVASGPNTSRPHAVATEREVEAGDLVTLDIGARVDGYCADLTRTVCVGTADDRQRDIHAAVLAANRLAIEGARAGMRGADIDEIARTSLVEAGFGEHFGHGLGHGVGLDVHELPSVSPRGREAVPAGSVVTIEPGVYVPGFGGVRIEDLVVIEDGGCTVLSNSPRELIELTP
jgi:Xaa-Pro aminopeptidase